MKDTKANRFVQLRLEGQGVRQAARNAGFNHGVPSKHALELHERVLMVRTTPSIARAAREQAKQAKESLRSSLGWIAAHNLSEALE